MGPSHEQKERGPDIRSSLQTTHQYSTRPFEGQKRERQFRLMHDCESTMIVAMNIWLLSTYHTGSHRSWAMGYRRHSRHSIKLITMAGRFWKWRMQGGAIDLADQAGRLLETDGPPDLVLATDMVNVPAWLGLLRQRCSGRDLPSFPIALYMHENQLTYPGRPGEKPDYTYAMINWLSQMSADLVIFNSRYHQESWFDALPRLLKHFPDYNHLRQVEQVRSRSTCLPVGIDFSPIDTQPIDSQATNGVPLILWNQRWEYDKQPDRFFDLIYRLRDEGVRFRLAVAGENFRNVPAEFEEARIRLDDCIVHWGYVADYTDYLALLRSADLVISTAIHEFFGISILEAIAGGAFPLLPQRLSYPELIPESLHPSCLYTDEDDLYAKARLRLEVPRSAPPSLHTHVREHFDWPAVAAAYDDRFEEMKNG